MTYKSESCGLTGRPSVPWDNEGKWGPHGEMLADSGGVERL